MEHDRRAVATFFVETELAAGVSVSAGEAAAHHARVKRLAPGDAVRVANGRGAIGVGRIARLARGTLEVSVEAVEQLAPPTAMHLRVPVADRDRMLWLAEKATELGVTTWQAVRFQRSASVSPRGEGAAFAARVRARMIAAVEQSGGGWLPAVLHDAPSAASVEQRGREHLLLDAAGEPLPAVLSPLARPVVAEPDILIGPEGGLEPSERDALVDAGWRPVRLAAATLRFETAGIAAVAAVRAWTL